MKRILIAYFGTLLAFLILDGLWLGVLMGPTYREWLGPLMLDTPVLGPAIAFYLLYGAGVVFFGVMPALRVQRLSHATLCSGLLGLIAYGTYDLTNWATLQGLAGAAGAGGSCVGHDCVGAGRYGGLSGGTSICVKQWAGWALPVRNVHPAEYGNAATDLPLR
ncbi:hypothetical protein PSYPI_23012 [Pseudomonas syringae pv. pisi str. 1704B]|uniref:DUF2177 family protein n=1 Tax=Pseudomonas syringae pv. pisi str. 1704B TaxID=629263 RepID=F3GDA8_PSESJ|nr:hypothetical protein PSYPI_23012 [Pseudomonas syringae pv. pisi str. 1704B]